MITIRTDGSGISYNDERLKSVSEILDIIPFQNLILRIHDHKGVLNVLWNTDPLDFEKDLARGIWSLFNESEIYHKTLSQ